MSMKAIQIGYSHETIKKIKDLKKHSINGLNLIEDLSILAFLKDDNKALDTFIYCPEIINKAETIKIKEYFIKNSKEVYEVSSKVYLSIVDKENSAGLIGIYKENIKTINDLDPNKHKFLVVLDHLENPGNIGTLFRTGDGCKVDGIILVDEIVKSNSYKVIQASRGMSLFIDKFSLTYEEAQKYLLDHNYDIYLGEPKLGKSYQEYDYKGNIALIVGNERFGINEKWYQNKNLKVFIPMSGKMPCLNVSIAGSILIYEAFMKRNRF